MPLTRFRIPPGLNRRSTQYSAGQTWYDANNVRWRTEYPETIGGWRVDPDNGSTYYGLIRSLWSWKDFSGDSYRFIGTNSKYYLSSGENKIDITPIRSSATISNPFAELKNGSYIATITHTDHGASVGDFVVFDSITSSTVGGIAKGTLTDVDEGFEIVDILSSSLYMIAMFDSSYNPIPATSDEDNAGGSCDIKYKVPSGLNSSVESGRGWGAGAWGDSVPKGLDSTTGAFVTSLTVSDGSISPSLSTANLRIAVNTTFNLDSGAPQAGDLVYIDEVKQGTATAGTVTTTTVGSPPFPIKELSNSWHVIADASLWASNNSIDIVRPDGETTTSTGILGAPKKMDGTTASQFALADTSTTPDNTVSNITRNWGESSTDSLSVDKSRKVYVDNFGEDLLISNSNGPIYYYDTSSKTSVGVPTIGQVAVDITSVSGQLEAVENCTLFIMSEKFGHCVALGANDIGLSEQNSMLVRWSDSFNPFDWFPTPSNEAGGQTLDEGSSIVTGISTSNENLIFTNSAIYSMKYVGFPITYGFNLVTAKSSIASENSLTAVDNEVFFMANDGFYMYNGRLNQLSDNVVNYVFDDINESEISKAFCDTNYQFSEIIFFYPSSGSSECDRAVSYNYSNSSWSIIKYDMSPLGVTGSGSGSAPGTSFNRTAWEDARIYSYPVSGYLERYNTQVDVDTLSDGDSGQPSVVGVNAIRSSVFAQESGTSAQNSRMSAYVETGDMDLMDGQNYAFYSRIIPDLEIFDTDGNSDRSITVGIKGRDLPGKSHKPEKSINVLYSSGETNEYAPDFNSTAIRGRARSASIRISSESSDFSWRLGDIRVDIKPDGEKS